MRIIRAGEHIQHIPGYGISVRESGVAVVAANWWEVAGKTCVAAYQPKGAASYAASKVNLANPGTYNAYEGVAPDWAPETGWTFNGTNNYLKTGFYSTETLTSIVRYVNGAASTGRSILGTYSSLGSRRHAIGIDDTHMMYQWAALQNYTWGTPDSGVAALSGQTSNGVCYKDGEIIGTLSSTWGTSGGGMIDLGVRGGDWAGNPYTDNGWNYFDGVILAVAFYEQGLDAAEIATLSTHMAAL